jgi:23S rRNA (uracil1939-C5)-methyltransferase
VVLNVNAEPGNALLGARTITLSGRDHIFDKVDGLRFRISFGSFYQLHRRAQALLYAPAMAMLTGGDGDLRGQTVIDGYGGIGTFGLRCSRRHAEVVHIVEANPEAVADARHNAAQVKGRVEVHHTPFAAVDLPTPDLLIVDPNRAGLRAEGRARVLALGPPRILYVACGLEALARDLDGLPGYRVRDLRLADLFPHTGHVEVLALLERL